MNTPTNKKTKNKKQHSLASSEAVRFSGNKRSEGVCVHTCAAHVHPHLHLSEGLRRQMTQENRSGRHVLRDVVFSAYVLGIWFNLCRALHVCVCVCVCVCARARECISGSFCMWQVCVFVCVHACMYAWTHAHTRIHTHTHMPMNIHEGLHLVFRLEVKGLDLGACGARPDVHCARDPALEAERALLPPLAPHRSARRRR